MTPRRSRLGRLLAALLVRGDEAPFLLRDLDDAFANDVARGLTPAAVRRRDLWNILASAWSVWTEPLKPSAWRPSLIDVRLGLRTIARTPWISLVAVAALAVGIPVGLAPMHAVDALERPLPGDPDGRIRTLCYWRDTVHEPATAGDYAVWRTSLRSFATLAAYRQTTVHLGTAGVDRPVAGVEVTASTFDVLRSSAMLGRVLRADDEPPGAPDVVVVGHDLWRSQFGGDPGVLGRPLLIDGVAFTVVGVMPPGFRFPTAHQVWMPLRLTGTSDLPRSGGALGVVGTLANGATPEIARVELQTLTSAFAARDPDAFERLRAAVLPAWHLSFDFPSPGGLRALPEFGVVQTLMLAPLFVACVNVGLLILAQTSTRASEFALRTALGAGRGRILTQMFVEFLVLAVLAAGVGVWLLDRLSARLMTAFGIAVPYWLDTGLTAATLLRGLILSAGCAIIAAVAPAVRMTGRSIDANIKHARASRAGGRLGGLAGGLIAIDVAVAVVAIGVAVGLAGKVMATMARESTDGVRAEEILSVTLDVRASSPPDVGRAQAALVDRLRGEGDVRAVTFATALPRMDHPSLLFDVEGEAFSVATPAGPFRARTARIAIDYFDQLDRPIVAGRGFDARDLDADATIIVNTTFARRTFGSANPIGRRVRQATRDGSPAGPWMDIVGVVGPLGAHALTPSEDDAVYRPLAAGEANPVHLAVWMRGDPAVLAPRLPALARAVDANAVVTALTPLDERFESDWYFLRAFVVAAGLIVAVLLSLAASALYAILSLVVAERTREIGIRVALGATRGSIARDVATRAVAHIGAGVLLGLPIAGALCYEFLALMGRGSVPVAVAMVAALGGAVLLLVSFAACARPTLRALRITPIEALRRDG